MQPGCYTQSCWCAMMDAQQVTELESREEIIEIHV